MQEKIHPEAALIEQGVIKGREALAWLDTHGSYVYHGGAHKLELLEPRQAHTLHHETKQKIKDGEPAVWAGSNYDMAIFKSIFHNNLGKKGDWSGWGSPDGVKDGRLEFHATKNLLDETKKQQPVGWVHVFDKNEFTQHKERSSEYCADHKVKPIFTIEVSVDDLPGNIKEVEPLPK